MCEGYGVGAQLRVKNGAKRIRGEQSDWNAGFFLCHLMLEFTFSFSIYCLALAFEHYRQVYIVHSGLQDESLQVTISKLP